MPQEVFCNEVVNNHTSQYVGCGVILNGIITDDGMIYDFFNNCHHINDSGDSYIYDIPNIVESGLYHDEEYTYINSNKIIDLCTQDPYVELDAADDLAEHMSQYEDTCFYGIDLNEVITYLDHGKRIRFGILFPMYYFQNSNLDNKVGRVITKLWGFAVQSAISGGMPHVDNNIDPVEYSPGNTDYGVQWAMNVPGLVYECCKKCEGFYELISFNENDEYSNQTVTLDELELILQGVQHGLNILNICDNGFIFNQVLQNMTYNIGTNIDKKRWFDFETRNQSYRNVRAAGEDGFSPQDSPDGNMVNTVLQYWNSAYNGEDGDYDNNRIIISESQDIIYANQYPIFIMKINETEEYGEFSGDSELEIRTYWNDSDCSAHRPEKVYIDLYVHVGNSTFYYDTVTMCREDDRIDRYCWEHLFQVPLNYNGSAITWYIKERDIPFRDSNGNPIFISGQSCYNITYYHQATTQLGELGVSQYDSTINRNSEAIYNTKSKHFLKQTVNITLEKVWIPDGCFDCNTSAEFTLQFLYGKDPITINGTFNQHSYQYFNYSIMDSLVGGVDTISLTETTNGWNYLVDISDDCRYIKVTNLCSTTSATPIDRSEIGNLFYFEVNPNDYIVSQCQADGFGVSGHWGDWENDEGRKLLYKICYHPVNFTNYTPNSQEYINFISSGWMYYIPHNNLKDGNGNITALNGFEFPISNAHDEIIVPFTAEMANAEDTKVRIYIGCAREHVDARKLDRFKLNTWRVKKGMWELASVQDYPNPDSMPIRCGGYINSLYGLSVSGSDLEQTSLNGDPAALTDTWRNLIKTDLSKLPFTMDGDTRPKPPGYSLYSGGHMAHAQETEYFYLGGNNLIPKYLHNQQLVWRQWKFSGLDPDPSYAFVLNDEYTPSNSNEANPWNSMKSMYARLLENNKNLVDIENLIIPPPYNDFMYYHTFANTGLGFDAGGLMNVSTYPALVDYDGGTGAVAPFMGMYKNCKYISIIGPEHFLREEPDILLSGCGLNYYDSMFMGCTNLTICKVMFFLQYGFPHGVCHNMFRGCSLEDQEVTIIFQDLWPGLHEMSTGSGTHAFHGMFRNTHLPEFQDLGNVDPSVMIPPFIFAQMYQGWKPSQGQSINLKFANIGDGAFWKMFALSGYVEKIGIEVEGNLYGKWSFGKMLWGCYNLNGINVKFNTWRGRGGTESINPRYGTYRWVMGAGLAQSNCNFVRYSSQLRKVRGYNRIPRHWSVTTQQW